ncbi:MAG: hypothetical protein H6587_06230 [Flavobacteriales bacterium]|nr:hypothetical protein [Flavobacteriales bacterium]MCB9364144.1 hypothetical protein [Flavobacteriales bacterium]
MKNLLAILIVLFAAQTGFGQQSEMSIAFKNNDYQKVLELCNINLQSDSTDINAILGKGRAYTGLNEFKLAIPYLLKVKDGATANWQTSWALIDLMSAYFSIGEVEKAKDCYNEALKIKGTSNSTSSLKKLGLLFGFDSYFNKWETVEKGNIIFHFQKTSSISSLDNCMKEREIAYSNINDFFSSEMPKKIDFFVWKSNSEAEKILGTSLGFSRPQNCISHNRLNQTTGHEITHCISFWRDKDNVRTRLINEGMGVYFDQTNSNRMVKAKEVASDIKIDIKDMWVNEREYPEQVYYPVAGAWVEVLILYDKVKFLKLSKNQTYENALIIYGDELNTMIEEFNNKVNSLK